MSDEFLTTHSGFLDNFQRGDLILADKGFNITNVYIYRNDLLYQLTYTPLNHIIILWFLINALQVCF